MTRKDVTVLASMAVLCALLVLPVAGLSQTPAPKLPKEITFATAREGTVSYTVAVGMSNLISKYTAMKCIVQPIGFIMQWGPSMKKGDIQISHQSASASYAYHYGGLWWSKLPAEKWLQQLTSGSDLKYGFHVRADSKIQTFKDLVGKKLYCNFPSAPSMMPFVDGLFEYYGIQHKDVKELVITDFNESVEEVIDGRADCVLTAIGAAYQKIKQAGGCRVLPISKEAAEYQNKKYPFHSHAMVPAGYLGLPAETLVMTDPQILLTHKDVPEEATYQVLKALYDHYDELAAIHTDGKDWTLERANQFRSIPYHTGAIRFLKEKKLWTPQVEEFQKQALVKDLKKK